MLPENKFVKSVLLLVQMASVYFYHYKSLTVGVVLSPMSCFVFIKIITVLDIILITQFIWNIYIRRWKKNVYFEKANDTIIFQHIYKCMNETNYIAKQWISWISKLKCWFVSLTFLIKYISTIWLLNQDLK